MRAKYNSYADAELAGLYNLQDQNAFEAIYNRYWDLLYIFAKKMLGDEDQAQDAVQELFTNLFNKMGQIKLKPDFSSYLYQGLRNLIIDQMRKEKTRFNYVAAIQAYAAQGEPTTDHQVHVNELKRIIESEVQKLPPKMRAIFEMSKQKYLSNQEIAKELNTSEHNVRAQLRDALARLQRKLGGFMWLQIMVALLWMNRHL